jgi:hypothetical protein
MAPRVPVIAWDDLVAECARLGIRTQEEYAARYSEIVGAPADPLAMYRNCSYARLFGARGPDRIPPHDRSARRKYLPSKEGS